MKKGQETGFVILISLIALILLVSQYYIFFVLSPNKIIQINSRQYISSEIDLDLITFVKLNSDLIIKSVNSNDYNELEKEINKLKFDKCWEIKIQDKIFNKDCKIKDPDMTIMNIPNYNNNQIKIILNINKK